MEINVKIIIKIPENNLMNKNRFLNKFDHAEEDVPYRGNRNSQMGSTSSKVTFLNLYERWPRRIMRYFDNNRF